MNNNKSLKLYKKGFFKNVIDFLKKLINRDSKEISTAEQDTNINDSNSKNSIFLDSIKLNQENIEQSELQIKFENNEINFDDMSNEEIHSLNELYKNQIKNLKKEIENKKIELNMLKFKTTNNLPN